jgi:hypothetical protein
VLWSAALENIHGSGGIYVKWALHCSRPMTYSALPANHLLQFLSLPTTIKNLRSSTATPALHDTTQSITMASLTHTSRTFLRALPQRANGAALPIRALSTSSKKSNTTSSFDSPFRGMGNDKASQIPDFSKYRSKSGTNSNLVFQYFMVGTMGALTAAGAKATVQGKFWSDSKGTWRYEWEHRQRWWRRLGELVHT